MKRRINQFISLFKKTGFNADLKHLIGYRTSNILLFQTALNHRSVKDNPTENNERLEFLGDAILGAIIADYLFKMFPFKDEGFLTQLRSKIVNGQSLKELALKFGFNNFLQATLTKEEKIKSSAYGDAFEALIGAVFLDLGYLKTQEFIISKIIKL